MSGIHSLFRSFVSSQGMGFEEFSFDKCVASNLNYKVIYRDFSRHEAMSIVRGVESKCLFSVPSGFMYGRLHVQVARGCLIDYCTRLLYADPLGIYTSAADDPLIHRARISLEDCLSFGEGGDAYSYTQHTFENVGVWDVGELLFTFYPPQVVGK